MSNPSHVVHTGPKDLFQHVRLLGRGNASVDEVLRPERPGHTYARKCFFVRPDVDRSVMRRIQMEIAIMRRLDHTHILSFMGSYEWEDKSLFYLLMSPVAEENLQTFLDRVDRLEGHRQSQINDCRRMQQWVPCLIRALSYVHSMSIRHKDIKPANILINSDGRILLADFGIANDFAGLTTTGTTGQAVATWMYAAPEVSAEQRRGRSADLFSFGCVLLEICTVASGVSSSARNSLRSLHDHLRRGRPTAFAPAYCEYPFLILDWICLCLGASSHDPDMGNFIHLVLQLVFLAMDPDAQKRITAHQMADMLSDSRCGDFHELSALACQRCYNSVGCPPQDIPLHSVFRNSRSRQGRMLVPTNLKTGLALETPGREIWENVKRRWLLQHIWWDPESVVS